MGNVFYSPCLILSAATGHRHIPPGLSRPSIHGAISIFPEAAQVEVFFSSLARILWDLNFPG